MRWLTPVALLVLAGALAGAAPGFGQVPVEPAGYREDDYAAPTPATLRGAA